jgi:hypothetical protein
MFENCPFRLELVHLWYQFGVGTDMISVWSRYQFGIKLVSIWINTGMVPVWHQSDFYMEIRTEIEIVEFIWSVCGWNELELKKCIHTYSDDLISIYVHILCIFRTYKREQKIVFKTFKERNIDIIQEGDNSVPPWRKWEWAVFMWE